MKATTMVVISAVPFLGKLSNLGIITILKAKQIKKALEPVQKELDEYDEARKAAVKKYDVENKTEKDVDPKVWAAFQKEYAELLEEEHDFPNLPIEIPGNATGLSPNDVGFLEDAGFITVKE